MIKIDILYEDNQLVVCIKPVGADSEGAMPELLKDALGGSFYCVHRLDRAVGGVMVYARTKAAAAGLTEQFASSGAGKAYLAVAAGSFEESSGIMRDLLFKDSAKNKSYVVKRMRKGVKAAELEYTVLGMNEGSSLLEIRLHTGRSHQIRVQLSSRKHPLLGDVKYGSLDKSCGIALFSHSLRFTHPLSGKALEFSAKPENVYPWSVYSDILAKK